METTVAKGMGVLAKMLEESTLRQSDNIRQRQIARQEGTH